MNHTFFKKVWKWGKWPLFILVTGYIALVAYRTHYFLDQDKTNAAVAKIHATRLTKDDVFGSLPPNPEESQNNATLAGVDSNNNGIRDDVEIAIYNAHKDSAKTSAAMLQYAKELQMEFMSVFNSPTLVAVIQEESRGYICIPDNKEIKEVEALVFNTDSRKQFQEDIRQKFMTSYGLPNKDFCDLNPSSFNN